MRARCTRDKGHKHFVTVVHVAKDIVVDENGDFVDSIEQTEEELVHGPNAGNTWTCSICGAEAEVEE